MAQTDQPTNVGSNDQLGLVTKRAKVGDSPLCEQMQELQARAMKLHPIDLHDPQLDTADPYTRLFLLAEYWQRQAKESRACLDDECDRADSLLTILGLEVDPCRSEGGSLVPHKVITLMAEAGHPPRFSDRDTELLGNGLAYIIREYPEKAEHARALLERMKPANVGIEPPRSGRLE
jgi:hypothetical protein